MGSTTFTWKQATAGTYTFVCPAGVVSAKVECVGGGGGGGQGHNAANDGGGGGGGGEYAAESALALTPGNSYTVVVGAAGAAGNGSVNNGGAGGSTTFAGDSVTVTAHGGGGGTGAANGAGGSAGTGSSNATHHNGGAGAAGSNTSKYGGGGGSSGGSGSSGNAGSTSTGGSAVTGGGPGGTGGVQSGGAGQAGSVPASAPGGGGGGGMASSVGNAFNGGAGQPGQVIVTMTLSSPATLATPGTWTWLCPAGTSTVKAEMWGGGGGGAGATVGSGSGGGGEYAAEPSLAVTATDTYTITVGAAGTGGPHTGGNGGNGGSSSMAGDSVTVTANGGSGATSTTGAAGGTGSSNTTHHNGGAGGNGHTGTPESSGGGGGSAGPSSAGNAGTAGSGSSAGTGGTAVTGGGAGGNGAISTGATDGGAGSAPGGGGGTGVDTGSGGTGTNTGGAGGAGQAILTWFGVFSGSASQTVTVSRTAAMTVLDPGASASLSVAVGLTATLIVSTKTALATQTVTVARSAAAEVTTFPQALLDLDVDIDLAGTWTDISDYVYQRQAPAVTITRGKPDETTQCNPSQAKMTLNNRDGRFSSRNPVGAYYGKIGRNTPMRISVPDQSTYLRLADSDTSGAQCSDSSSLRITGSIDVRIDLDLDDYSPALLCSKWGSTATSWALALNGDGTLTWTWFDGSSINQVSTEYAIPLGRVMIRVTMTASSGMVQFFTAAQMGASQTLLQSIAGSGSTAIASGSGQTVRVGYSGAYETTYGAYGCLGQVYEFRLYTGIAGSGGTIVADPVFAGQAQGTGGFTDAYSNAWSMYGTAEISGRSYRYHGEMSSLPVAWDPTAADVYVPLTSGGILRRLSQGNALLPSAMKRAILAANSAPVAYWPCEDLQGSTQLASAVSGGLPMMIASGKPKLASDTTFLASSSLPDLNGSQWNGAVGYYASTGTVVVRFLLNIDSSFSGVTDFLRIDTTGTGGSLDLIYFSGMLTLGITNEATSGDIPLAVATPVMVSVELTTSSGTVTARLRTMTVEGVITTLTTATYSGTAGRVTGISVAPFQDSSSWGGVGNSTCIGHVFVQDGDESLSDFAEALAGWAGETAGNRFARLCTENGIASRIYGFPDVSVPMGAQTIDMLQNCLQACEDADRGIIYEPRQALGLGYRTLASMCNQAAAVTLDYAQKHLGREGQPGELQPTDDDQFTVNDVTLQRQSGSASGSSIVVTLDDGTAMSISPPPAGVGDYASQYSANLNTDDQLPFLAGWILHIGTVNEERYPSVPLNLSRPALASLIYAIQDLNMGDYLAIDNILALVAPSPVKQLVYGCTEKLGGFIYEIDWMCVPESPYEVAVLDDAVYGRADTGGSALHASITSAATSMQVDVTGDTLWTTSAADFPFDVIMGPVAGQGEQVTVTNITGASSPQTFTITRSVNGVVMAHSAGEDIRLRYPPSMALT